MPSWAASANDPFMSESEDNYGSERVEMKSIALGSIEQLSVARIGRIHRIYILGFSATVSACGLLGSIGKIASIRNLSSAEFEAVHNSTFEAA